MEAFNYSSNGSEGRTMSEIEQLPPAVILKKMHDFSPTEKILARMESEQTESQYSSTNQGQPPSSMSSTINKDSTIKKGAKYNSPFIHPAPQPARVVNPPRLALKLQTEFTDASSSVMEDIMLSSEVESSQRQQHSDKRSSLRDKYFRSSIGFTSSSGSYSTFKQGSTKTASMALASYFTNSQDEKKRKKKGKKVKSLDLEANKENKPITKIQKKVSQTNEESKEEVIFSNQVYGHILKWKMGPIVGFGVSGEVIKAMNIKSGSFFAVKRIQLFQDFESIDPLVVDRLKVEISILKKLRHRNIVKYIGGENDTERGCFYIYLEYIPSGCLRKIYQEFGPFRENSLRNYARQILEGLQYLHKHNIVHCDLKCANVLVDKNGTIKLSDFGCSHILEQSLTMEQGRITGTWMAPEVILADNTSSQISNAADIWSFGCTLIEMLRAGSPYEEEETEQRGFNGVVKMALSKVSPSPPKGISSQLESLIKQCLQWERKDRPSAKELLLHPFFQE